MTREGGEGGKGGPDRYRRRDQDEFGTENGKQVVQRSGTGVPVRTGE